MYSPIRPMKSSKSVLWLYIYNIVSEFIVKDKVRKDKSPSALGEGRSDLLLYLFINVRAKSLG